MPWLYSNKCVTISWMIRSALSVLSLFWISSTSPSLITHTFSTTTSTSPFISTTPSSPSSFSITASTFHFIYTTLSSPPASSSSPSIPLPLLSSLLSSLFNMGKNGGPGRKPKVNTVVDFADTIEIGKEYNIF